MNSKQKKEIKDVITIKKMNTKTFERMKQFDNRKGWDKKINCSFNDILSFVAKLEPGNSTKNIKFFDSLILFNTAKSQKPPNLWKIATFIRNKFFPKHTSKKLVFARMLMEMADDDFKKTLEKLKFDQFEYFNFFMHNTTILNILNVSNEKVKKLYVAIKNFYQRNNKNPKEYETFVNTFCDACVKGGCLTEDQSKKLKESRLSLNYHFSNGENFHYTKNNYTSNVILQDFNNFKKRLTRTSPNNLTRLTRTYKPAIAFTTRLERKLKRNETIKPNEKKNAYYEHALNVLRREENKLSKQQIISNSSPPKNASQQKGNKPMSLRLYTKGEKDVDVPFPEPRTFDALRSLARDTFGRKELPVKIKVGTVLIEDDADVKNMKDRDKVFIGFPSNYNNNNKDPSGKRLPAKNYESKAIQQTIKLNEQQNIDRLRADYDEFKSNYSQGIAPYTNYLNKLKNNYPGEYNKIALAQSMFKQQLEQEAKNIAAFHNSY